jgi:hypothetical protein
MSDPQTLIVQESNALEIIQTPESSAAAALAEAIAHKYNNGEKP